MKNNFSNRVISFGDSGFGCLLTIVLVSLLLGSVGLQWVVNGVLIIIALLIITPIIALWGFRWWLKKNLIQDNCPVCDYGLTGLANNTVTCTNCGAELKVESGKFIRETPPGTIDVDVVDVEVEAVAVDVEILED